MTNRSKFHANETLWIVEGDKLKVTAPKTDGGVDVSWESEHPGIATMGILQDRIDEWGEELSKVTLCPKGTVVRQGESIGTATDGDGEDHDLPSPVAGEIRAVNSEVVDEPELVVSVCYEEGWLVKIKPLAPGLVAALDRLPLPGQDGE